MSKINVQNIEIGYQVVDDQDYICLTDMAKQKDGRIEIIIQNWMRNRMTIEFLGLWEKINNPKFNHIEFDVFRSKAGLNSFYLTPTQWMEKTNAIGIITLGDLAANENVNTQELCNTLENICGDNTKNAE